MPLLSHMKQRPGFYREVVVLATPIVMQNLITSCLSLADTFMVGLLGEVPMAAVTLANIPLFVVQLFIFGVQSGASVLISQYWGKKDMESINRVIGVALWVVLSVSALFAAILLIAPLEFLSLFGNEPKVIALAAQYGGLASLSYVCNAFTMMYVAAYRSMERPKLGMYILAASMTVNTFLNWVFIFGNLGAPAMGVKGAALATLIARGLEVVIVVSHMAFNRFFKLRAGLLLRPGGPMFLRFLRYGGMVVCNETMWGLGTSVYPTVMGHMQGSTEILAAYTVAGNVEKLVTVFGFGLAATAAIVIGREIGAGRPQQVKSMGIAMDVLGFTCGAILGVSLWAFGQYIAPVWVFPLFKLSPGASSVATMMLGIMGATMPLRNFNSVNIVGVLRGGGDVKAATLIDISPLWLCAIPWAVVCGTFLKTSVFWVYFALVVEQLVKTGLGIWRLQTGKWVRDITQA